MRIFLSFNSKDTALAEALRAGLLRFEPGAEILYSPASLGADFWMPKFALADHDSFDFLETEINS